MAIPVKLQAFEGPLDLLLHLIDKNKVDIYDIPIAEITDQYLAYVRELDTDDMNVTSEFLVMAATLLDIKSRMLLPRTEEPEEEEEDPREELVRRLLEYKKFKFLAGELKDRGVTAGKSMYREKSLPQEVEDYTPPLDYEQLLGSATLERLSQVFRESLKRSRDRKDPVRSGFGKIQREQLSMGEKRLYVEAWLSRHPSGDFAQLLENQESKEEIIVTFLVVLELIRESRIRVRQDEIFGRILIEAVPPEERQEQAPAEPAETPSPEEKEEPETLPPEPVETEPFQEEPEEETPEADPEDIPADETYIEETEEYFDHPAERSRVSAGPALLACAPEAGTAERILETEEWTEIEQRQLLNRSCLSWGKPWKSRVLRRPWRSLKRKCARPRRSWRRNMRDLRADWT